MAQTPTFILIHGAWHGAWCWHKLIPLLEAGGARVIAPDLPSMGADNSSAESVTLDSWARFVAGLAEREQDCRLVGHSRAGVIISRAAELAPRHIGQLVYLSAYLLRAGDRVAAEARPSGVIATGHRAERTVHGSTTARHPEARATRGAERPP